MWGAGEAERVTGWMERSLQGYSCCITWGMLWGNKTGSFQSKRQWEGGKLSPAPHRCWRICMSLSAGTPADILPLVEAFPKFKDTDKGDKDKGLFLMSLRVAGAAQLTFQTEPVPDGFRAELPSSCSAVAVLICRWCIHRRTEGPHIIGYWSGAVFEPLFPLVVQFWMKNCQDWCTCLEREERRGQKCPL